jgi:hypothetical protein
MPNCFQLTRKSDPDAGPVVLQRVDDELRLAMGEPPDPEHWLWGWMDWLGLALACGKDWAWIRAERAKHQDTDGVRCVDWFESQFLSDAWFSRSS